MQVPYVCRESKSCQRKYVLTGGPGVGKSTLLQVLYEQGYEVVQEIGRELIEEQQRENGQLLPWIDRDAYQRELLRRRLIAETTTAGSIVFLDRGIPDGLAFYKLSGIAPPAELVAASRHYRYSSVFILDPLPVYCSDSARWHSKEDADQIHGFLLDVYTELGYEIKTVPALPVDLRAKWLLQHL